MLTIEHFEIIEDVTLDELFSSLEFHSDVEQTDESGDSFIECNEAIEVLSNTGFERIEGMRWTKIEDQVLLSIKRDDTNATLTLQCSPDHLVANSQLEWIYVKNLQILDKVRTSFGDMTVVHVQSLDSKERLCDLQVANSHSYFVNGILSHNSHFLVKMGANAMRAGKNVLHYTLELSETIVGRRYDSNLCAIDYDDIFERKQEVVDFYKNNKFGRLVIKEFPTGSASIYTLRSHIERLELNGFTPDVIIVDYADVMRSTRKFDSLRHELKLVYEELRGLANEKKLPLWTASQSNKEGAESDIIDLGNMSEAYGKAMVADIVISISRKAFEKATGAGRLYIAKSRVGKDGIVFPLKINTARSEFDVSNVEGTMQSATKENENAFKQALKEKWKQLQEEGTLSVDRPKKPEI